MYQAFAFFSTLWILFLRVTYGCPDVCICSTTYQSLAANCAYRSLQVVPTGFPSNLKQLSLSSNSLTALERNSFAEVAQLTSLWLAYNTIHSIEKGSFEVLALLKSLDVSENQIVDFPWEDLKNLTSLQVLKMDHNHMVYLPRDAFHTLKELRYLQISDNKFTTILEGTFDSLSSLSSLQIYSNPFNCTCHLMWIKTLTENTLISIPERERIVCSTPENLKGIQLQKLPNPQCLAPSVHLTYHPLLNNTELYDRSRLMLNCNVTGKPQPVIRWKIQASSQLIEISEPYMLEARNDMLLKPSKQSTESFLVFKNGTLVIPRLSKQEEGVYTCLATNELGSSEQSISVAAASSPKFQLSGRKTCDDNERDLFPHGQNVVIIYQTGDGMKGGGGISLCVPPWLWFLALFILIFN
uniref:immunoglobulin superfamily containing leucine-rich repeat protein-like n=1 Tax=Geotrypetes seraphini TaxID=260995 RepID=UPI0014586C2E|nr:immunoglobulin superfamily containing leucine-rich repeat protein-like [Geotrypetes seraphini]